MARKKELKIENMKITYEKSLKINVCKFWLVLSEVLEFLQNVRMSLKVLTWNYIICFYVYSFICQWHHASLFLSCFFCSCTFVEIFCFLFWMLELKEILKNDNVFVACRQRCYAKILLATELYKKSQARKLLLLGKNVSVTWSSFWQYVNDIPYCGNYTIKTRIFWANVIQEIKWNRKESSSVLL